MQQPRIQTAAGTPDTGPRILRQALALLPAAARASLAAQVDQGLGGRGEVDFG
jgi:hypothetical protein